MNKKLVWLLSMALAILLPFSALAETSQQPDWLSKAWEDGEQIITTLTVAPGELLAQQPAISDLLNALAIKVVGQKDGYGSLTIQLSGQDALSGNIKTTEDGFFFQSALVGQDILYFSLEDLEELIASLTANSDAPGAAATSQLDSLRDLFTQNQPADLFSITPLDIEKELPDIIKNDPVMMQWIEDIQKRMVVSHGDYLDPSHDPATDKQELTLNQEDILVIMDSQYMRLQLKQTIAASNADLTAEQLDTMVQESIDEGKAQLQSSTIDMPITVLANGETVVSMSMPIHMSMAAPVTGIADTTQDAAPPSTQALTVIDMPISYNRLTTGDAVNHSFQMDVNENSKNALAIMGTVEVIGETNFEFNVDIDDKQSTKLVLKGYGVVEGEETALAFHVVHNGKDIFQIQATIKDGMDALDAKVDLLINEAQMGFTSPQASAEPTLDTAEKQTEAPADTTQAVAQGSDGLKRFITLSLHSVAAEPDARFAALQEATPQTAVQILKMTLAELVTIGQSLAQTSMQTVFGALSLLPPSVLINLGGLMQF